MWDDWPLPEDTCEAFTGLPEDEDPELAASELLDRGTWLLLGRSWIFKALCELFCPKFEFPSVTILELFKLPDGIFGAILPVSSRFFGSKGT
jgi:hypothetical protein